MVCKLYYDLNSSFSGNALPYAELVWNSAGVEEVLVGFDLSIAFYNLKYFSN